MYTNRIYFIKICDLFKANVLYKPYAKCIVVLDLYSDWVVAALEVSLLVETWPNGPGRLNSSCKQPYKYVDVKCTMFWLVMLSNSLSTQNKLVSLIS